jgi:hypothetical protein
MDVYFGGEYGTTQTEDSEIGREPGLRRRSVVTDSERREPELEGSLYPNNSRNLATD